MSNRDNDEDSGSLRGRSGVRASKRRREPSTSSEESSTGSSCGGVKRKRKSTPDLRKLMRKRPLPPLRIKIKVSVLANVLLQNVIQVLPNKLDVETQLTQFSGINSQKLVRQPVPGSSGVTPAAFCLQRPAGVADGHTEPRLLTPGLINTTLKDSKVP